MRKHSIFRKILIFHAIKCKIHGIVTNTLLAIILAVFLFFTEKSTKNHDLSEEIRDATSGNHLNDKQITTNDWKSQRFMVEKLIYAAWNFFAQGFITPLSKNSNFSWRKRRKRKQRNYEGITTCIRQLSMNY